MEPDLPGTSRTSDISELVLGASADGLVAVDDQGIIQFVNHAAEELLARPASKLTGAPLGFPVASTGVSEVELTAPGGGERVLELLSATTRLAGDRFQIVALRDVTRRKRAERELHEALDGQRMMLAVAAHELHSPLAAIGVLAHLLADDGQGVALAEHARIAERLAELTARLQLLVRRLLTAARIDAGGERPVAEPVRVLEVIMEQLASVDDSRTPIHVTCSPGLAAAVDRGDLSIMLANYLDNALAYARPPIEVRAGEVQGWAQIQVADYGPGVPDAFVPLLFERFTRSPEAARQAVGTGLGLWIVRAFARANGGDAWFEPGDRGGSSFFIRLPLAQAPPAPAATPPAPLR